MTLWIEPTPCAHGRWAHERCPACELMADSAVVTTSPPFQGHSITSLEAAHAVKPKTARYREQIYTYIREHPGSTDEQIAAGTGLSPNTARPRRVELQKAGRIAANGSTLTASGRSARTWGIVPTRSSMA